MKQVDQSLTRRVYFRGLGSVYLIAFLSLWVQVHGLIGSQGLLPAEGYFNVVHARFGAQAYRLVPSLCWFGCGDLALHLYCGAGAVLSLVLLLGFAPRMVLAALWAIYLSLTVAGQEFLGFQWDTLLLEMTLCSWLYAPRGWRPNWRANPTALACWLLWGLAFKLMFLSGVTKLVSGDASWLDGTALQFHYYTQPIPSWPAWYVSQLPLVVHRVVVWILLIIEVAVPLLVFAGRRGRQVFGLSTIALMVAIEATGNFGFFNMQTIVLCLPLLNDGLLRNIFQRGAVEPVTVFGECSLYRCRAIQIAVALILSASLLASVAEISSTARAGRMPASIMTPIRCLDTALLSWGRPAVLEPLSPFRTINGYGLFRVMTTRRSELIIEVSDDGIDWTPCEFPYKPGQIDRAPPIVAPHMPRLDWQMWFAALDPRGQQRWLSQLLIKLREGDPSTARLLGNSGLSQHPPQHFRIVLYEYNFTSADQKARTGAWWNRTRIGD